MSKNITGNSNLDMFSPLFVAKNETLSMHLGTEEIRVLCLLKDLEKTCAALLRNKDVVFTCVKGKRLVCGEVGRTLFRIARSNLLTRIEEIFPECLFNPFVRAAIDAIKAEKGDCQLFALEVYETMKEVQSIAGMMNRIVDRIRKRMSNEDFKAMIRNHERAVNQNRKSLARLVNAIFRRYAKVLVVRLDLSYLKSHFRPLDEQNLSCEDVVRHREKLLADLRKMFKGKLITYVWKLEYGPMRGYHYHAFFFFDGSQCMQDIVIAKMIGEHWANVVTGGSGFYFNCCANKKYYPALGIGMIKYDDWEKISNLKSRSLEYLVKADYYVKSIACTKIRTLGKGAAPKPAATNRGRPREGDRPVFGLRSVMDSSVALPA